MALRAELATRLHLRPERAPTSLGEPIMPQHSPPGKAPWTKPATRRHSQTGGNPGCAVSKGKIFAAVGSADFNCSSSTRNRCAVCVSVPTTVKGRSWRPSAQAASPGCTAQGARRATREVLVDERNVAFNRRYFANLPLGTAVNCQAYNFGVLGLIS